MRENAMSEANKEIVRKIEDAWNHNRLAELDQYFAPEFENAESATPGVPPGLAGAKMVHQMVMQSFPDRKVEIVDMISEGDKVYLRQRVTGSNKGGAPWLGAPKADGKPFDIMAWSAYTIKNGKAVKHAGINDGFLLAMQLGVIPAPVQA
jgi:predicted ester cyclase